MFDHLIVGVDGRDGGRDAVALATALRPKRITLVRAHPVEPIAGLGGADAVGAVHAETEKELVTLRDELAPEADTLVVADRSPARALQRVAQDAGADLIVIGSAHHGPVARLLLGDVGRAVIAHAPCAVAVAPRDYRDKAATPRRIAVGYDDGPEARAALEFASAAASELDAELTLVHAWDIPTVAVPEAVYLVGDEELTRTLKEAAQERLDAGLKIAGPKAKGVLERGEPSFILTSISEGQDLLVLGSRGWGPVRRIMLGSTSDRLVHRASCPVIVVPRPEQADAEGDAQAREGATA